MGGQVIFDLDGTLSDNRHREHLIEGEEKQWRKYFARCVRDSPVQNTISSLNELSEDHEIVILTCRSDEVEEETTEWLKENEINFDRLIMLPEGRWKIKDSEFKRSQLRMLDNPVMAFDDDRSNCKMFLEEGLESIKVGSLPEPEMERFQ